MREERRPENKGRPMPPDRGDRGGADMVVAIDTNPVASEWMDRGRWSYGTVTGRAEARVQLDHWMADVTHGVSSRPKRGVRQVSQLKPPATYGVLRRSNTPSEPSGDGVRTETHACRPAVGC